jgi:hypothetical protein
VVTRTYYIEAVWYRNWHADEINHIVAFFFFDIHFDSLVVLGAGVLFSFSSVVVVVAELKPKPEPAIIHAEEIDGC